jgi:hypothetical protein
MLCSSAGDDLDIKNAGVRASVELKETSAFEEKGATNERKCDIENWNMLWKKRMTIKEHVF